MKKFVFFLLVIGLFSSCKKKLTQFYIDHNSEVIIPSTLGQSLPFSLYTPEITTNSESEFASNNTQKDRVRSIYLKDLVLTITSPEGETFSFLNSVDIYISSPNNPEVKVAFKQSIPGNVGAVLKCDLSEADLQDYIKEETYKIRVVTVSDETIPQDVQVDIYTKYLVDAKLKK